MITSPFKWVLFLVVSNIAVSGCSSTASYPHNILDRNQVVGVYAYADDRFLESSPLTSVMTLASENYLSDIRNRLASMSTDKTVLKYFLQSFPSRTSARVLPIRDSQIVLRESPEKDLDLLATGKRLSLDYVMALKVKRSLKTTGYLYQELWKPQLAVNIVMTRIADGKVLLNDVAYADGKPFDKYLDTRALDKTLESSFSSLASGAVNKLSEKVGPPIRIVSEKEKLVHQKIHDYDHIRALAGRDNCIINGDLKISKTESLVTYQVPCRDITLTYACDSESEASRCWLQ